MASRCGLSFRGIEKTYPRRCFFSGYLRWGCAWPGQFSEPASPHAVSQPTTTRFHKSPANMELPVTLHETVRPDERADALPELDYVLNMALVYQDAWTEQWASQIRERVSQLVGPEAASRTAWKISDLSEPEVLKQAVLHTADADV